MVTKYDSFERSARLLREEFNEKGISKECEMSAASNRDLIIKIESDIDCEFLNTPLMQLEFSQSIWTLLSVMEDRYLKITAIKPIPIEQQHAYIDTLVNSLAHPVRALFRNKSESNSKITKRLIDDHYQWSQEWIDSSIIYNAFNLIFPLWHKKKINLTITGNYIDTGDLDVDGEKYGYEAYNRIIRKDGDLPESYFDVESVIESVMQNISVSGESFTLNFNPKLVALLVKTYSRSLDGRHVLPKDWKIGEVSFDDFKIVFTTIQAMLHGWFIARVNVAGRGLPGLGYSSAVWIVGSKELIARLSRYTSIDKKKIATILDYLKFANHNIRDPDIAIQPLLEINSEEFALSPLLWINTNAERNFCTLLNKIPSEREAYLSLTLNKEEILYQELREILERLGYEVTRGRLRSTDVDLSIIDRKNKICICVELKWFIEPAEIRETIERSIELEKGVRQSSLIMSLFKSGDKQLFRLLGVDNTYRFSSFVGSRNWIGHSDVQTPEIPIIKIWHFIKKLMELDSLEGALNWLESKSYLPINGQDYRVIPVNLDTGSWKSRWYGIANWPPSG